MTNQQHNHVTNLLARFVTRAYKKYDKGAAEHQSNLWECSTLQLLDFAIDEAIDQVTYLMTMRDKYLEENNADKSEETYGR